MAAAAPVKPPPITKTVKGVSRMSLLMSILFNTQWSYTSFVALMKLNGALAELRQSRGAIARTLRANECALRHVGAEVRAHMGRKIAT